MAQSEVRVVASVCLRGIRKTSAVRGKYAQCFWR